MRMRTHVSLASVLLISSALLAAQRPAGGPAGPLPDQAVADAFSMALTGDSIITRRLSVYTEPAFLRMIGLIRDTRSNPAQTSSFASAGSARMYVPPLSFIGYGS